MCKLSIIIVSFNTERILKDCLNAIYPITADGKAEIIVVDNNSSDSSIEMIGSFFSKIRIIRNKENLGFGHANNIGMAAAKGGYFLLLNSDTVASVEAIADSLNYLEDHPKVGLMGCRLNSPNCKIQLSSGRFFNLWNAIFGGIELNRFLESAFKIRITFLEHYLTLEQHMITQEVDWVAGAFMLLRSRVFRETGGFDKNIFFYGEEEEWCFRIRKNGWKIVFYADTQIIHIGKASISDETKSKINKIMFSRKAYFFNKHYGRLWVFAFKNLLFLGAILKLPFCFIFFVLSGFRQKMRSKVKFQLDTINWYFSQLLY